MYLNYYDLEDSGCCLICDDAEDGCLCYNCKCSKCSEYSGNDPETALEYTDEGGKWCRLVEFWQWEKEETFAAGQESSVYRIDKILRQTEKAVQCTLKTENFTSDSIFWIPLSVMDNKYVQKWFVNKEDIRMKFKDGVNSQSKLL